MERMLRYRTRLSRLSLLVAAIFQVAAAGVAPWAHSGFSIAAGATLAAPAPDDGEPGPVPTPHDEISCVFCQTLGGALLAEAPRLAVPLAIRAAAPAALNVSTPRHGGRRSPPARAPPLA